MNISTYLVLISLVSPSFGLWASLQPRVLFQDPYDRTPMQVGKREIATEKKEMRPFLITQLFESARKGDITRLTELYDEYGDLDSVSTSSINKGLTPVYAAVKAGETETVNFFAHRGAHMTRLFPRELVRARSQKAAGAAQQVENAQNGNQEDAGKCVESLLDVAIRYDHTKVALLLAQFIPLWMPNGEGKLPLCNAIRLGKTELAKALILAHASNIEHLLKIEGVSGGQSALICAQSRKNNEVAELIVTMLAAHKPQGTDDLAASKKVSQGTRLTSPWVVIPGLCVAGLILYLTHSKSSDDKIAENLADFLHSPMTYRQGSDY